MSRYFVPYNDQKPAAINVKGHNLVLVSTEDSELLKDLNLLGADRVEEVVVEDSKSKEELFLSNLAELVHGGVVLAPPGVDLKMVMQGLESELPWMH